METIKNNNIKKSTIMFTDIIGYSSMVNIDQAHAMDLLSMHDKILEPIIIRNNGKIIKKIGDAIFAEFPTPEDSCKSAITMQSKLTKRNELCQSEDFIKIRIGLHTGDVIHKDNDLFGHDVNLCSRIESIAPSCGIAASNRFINELPINKFFNREMGFIKLKNISNPEQIYKIYTTKQEYESETESHLYESLKENGINVVDIESFKIEDIFSIGILYIKNIGSKGDDSISYNLTENLINDLSNVNNIRSTGFNEILLYKESPLGINDIGRKLEVNHILQGSVLKIKNILKLDISLFNTNTGATIFSYLIEENILNVSIIREKIMHNVLKCFEIKMPSVLKKIYSKEITDNAESLELYYKSKYIFEKLKSQDDLKKSKTFIKKAIKLDNQFVEAQTLYGQISHRLGSFDKAESILLNAQELAFSKKYLQGESDAYRGLQVLYSDMGQYEKSRFYIEKAIKVQMNLNNNIFEARLRLDYANLLNHIGDLQLSIEQNKQAISILQELEEERLIGISNAVLHNIYYTMFKYSDAIKHGKIALSMFRKLEMQNYEGRILVLMAETYSCIGNFRKMREYLDKSINIIKQFNDLFFLGKIDYLKSKEYIQNNDFNTAHNYLDESIDWYDASNNQIFKIYSMIEKLKLYIEKKDFNTAESYLNKINIQTKKVQDFKDDCLLLAIKCFIEAKKGDLDLMKFEKINNKISNSGYILSMYSYWYIAQAFNCIDDKKNRKYFYNKSKVFLNKIAKNLTIQKDKDSYYNIYYHKYILNEIYLDSKIEPETQSIFDFCPKCGFNNEQNFQFCSSCGSNLSS